MRCWFAPKDIKGGRKLYEQIGEAIRLYEKVLLVLSEHSINSEWVKTEIAEAWQLEVQENRRVLFPIRLVDFKTIKQGKCFDADIGKSSAREIREYPIPDFSNGKSHDAYQQSFDRLLRDLKPELERKPELSEPLSASLRSPQPGYGLSKPLNNALPGRWQQALLDDALKPGLTLPRFL